MILECITLLCIAGLDGGSDYVANPVQEVARINDIVDPPIPRNRVLSDEESIGTVVAAEQAPPTHSHTEPTSDIGGVWQRLAVCESGMNGVPRWDYNGGSGFDGGIQFHPNTWTAFKYDGYPDYAYQATPAQQIEIGRQVAKAQGAGAWPSCTAKLGISTEDLLQ